MKIHLEALEPKNPKSGEDTYAVFHPGNACVRITQAFSAVMIETEDGALYGVALRDSGLEIVCPDGALVGIKRHYADGRDLEGRDLKEGGTFLERNGKVVG